MTGHSRKLAAILAADIAGYSALMGADEARTVSDLKGHQAVVLPMIAAHGGRVIDTAGDGILAEFGSVVNAVECAIAIQKTMAERNAAVEPGRQMQFRIGINLGDVIHDEQRVYGDGVNIAARLESISDPGGICISGDAYSQVHRKLTLEFTDLGDQHLKNITQPVRVYRVGSAQGQMASLPRKSGLALPDKPSIAVLPFRNTSGDPDQDVIGNGIAEDVLTELSKIRWLFVIAWNSSFTYFGKRIPVRDVGRELGVRYVLEGSTRRAVSRIRVTAQLVDATTGTNVWADRYDRDLTDIFALQDEITRSVAQAIAPAIAEAEQQRAVRKAPDSLDAWEAYQRGMWHYAKSNPSDNSTAEQFFRKALELDKNFAAAHVGLAAAIMTAGAAFHTYDINDAANEGEELARAAAALDPRDGTARARIGLAAYMRGDLETAIRHCEEAISIDPNNAYAHGLHGQSLVFAGRREEGRQSLHFALRLSPRDPVRASRLLPVAVSHYFDGDYEKAAEAAKETIRMYPGLIQAYRFLVAALGQLGRVTEAETIMAIAPAGYDQFARRRAPWVRPDDYEHMMDGMKKAGWNQ
jgi:adenylate cyclase